MRKPVFAIFLAVMVLLVFSSAGISQDGPKPASGAVIPPPDFGKPLPAVHPLDDSYLEWPLAPADKQYASIDGKHLHQYVSEISAISERYRDQGHQFWGRITGTSGDTETQNWVLDKFKQMGLSDVRAQSFDLPPQWMPQSWDVTATGEGKTLHIGTAQPVLSSPGTASDGLDLEAVYVGTASEADFVGRDVRGKAVFIYGVPQPAMWDVSTVTDGGTARAEAKGAAAIFLIFATPGNFKVEMYPTGNHVPTFAVGLNDGLAMRDLIGKSPGQPPHVKVRLDVQMVPNLKTATIWGTLPGMTDEKIYVMAHRDGFFDSATDDASGVATMVGVAEYFAKMPKEKRRRTMIFLATTGHHNNCKGGYGVCTISGTWIADHHDEVFKNTALLINCEHTATTQTYVYLGPSVRKADTQNEALFWYVGGSSRLMDIAINAYREFGVPTYDAPERSPAGEMGGFFQYAPSLQLIDVGMFAHTDQETPEAVPWTGLEGVVRAYAKIINDVNAVDIKDLQR